AHTAVERNKKSYSRKLAYVRTFLRLVRNNHRQERAIGFYADQMFISPKYLSLIIKEATGRSAAEWIDQYVIQEAKNLLKYSGKNVQQVAYELNFSNQSSFGKYFKHLTGLSPTQFQNQ
ncbi:MAG: helix-turn-helix domain-containing protein, partial [Muribaculaceae bacterium]